MPKVFVQFPKVGLGNMLLVWANALVYARQNNLQLVVGSWSQIHWGAIWRKEKHKRFYSGYFKQSSLWNIIRLKAQVMTGGQAAKNDTNMVIVFDQLVTHPTMFLELEKDLALIEKELYTMLSSTISKRINELKIPDVAMHIRRGDFVNSKQVTSLQYFKDILFQIQRYIPHAEVKIFSDAYPAELAEILSWKNVSLAEPQADILDILTMSRSRILVLSRDSTFSYWSAFLSKGLVIVHPDDWQQGIKRTTKQYKEVRWNEKIAADFDLILKEALQYAGS